MSKQVSESIGELFPLKETIVSQIDEVIEKHGGWAKELSLVRWNQQYNIRDYSSVLIFRNYLWLI